MKKDLPIFDIIINEEDLSQGVGRISLVDEPAIGVEWIKLAADKVITFKADKEKQLLYGPFLIPNKLIYRNDTQNGEYYVRFSETEIEKIATKFNEDLNNKQINLMHTDEMVDAFVAQNWMIEDGEDKSRKFGYDLPKGTWFGAVKVKDQNFWNDKVKNDEVRGFSVEILADLQLSLKNKNTIMDKQIKLGKAVLKDGVTVYWEGEFGMGTAIFVDEALPQKAPDAAHILEDGTIVTTKDGLVVEIEVSAVEEDMKGATLLADGACYEGYEQVGMKMLDGKEVPNCVPVKDGKPDPQEALVEDMPATEAVAITAEEVSAMIDARFADLMEEISNLKGMLGEKEEEYNNFKSSVNEKFSIVPAVASITKQKVVRLDDKFSSVEARIKEFAKNK